MFRDAKVGDRVWSIQHSWGNVIEVSAGNIYVEFDRYKHSNKVYHTKAGYTSPHDGYNIPHLFWDEVKIVPPPKPKRKVKKVVEGWANLYRDGEIVGCDCSWGIGPLWKTKETAIKQREEPSWGGRVAGDPIFIRHEYEVEE